MPARWVVLFGLKAVNIKIYKLIGSLCIKVLLMYFCQVMSLYFFKYHGAGNDFVIADNRLGRWTGLSDEQRSRICHRRYGVGADGIILLENDAEADFSMKYFNSDGKSGSMCGNGGRCIVAFAAKLGLVANHAKFRAVDGMHEAFLTDNGVRLRMQDVAVFKQYFRGWVLNTGSPHYVEQVSGLSQTDVVQRGRDIRYNSDFYKDGINVNFFEIGEHGNLKVRTYERGVEDETYACGTGVTAVTLAAHQLGLTNSPCNLTAMGGPLQVEFNYNGIGYSEVWLSGGAQFVFEGVFEL